MKKILFVCTGNTCRSCMAEGIFKALATEAGEAAGEFGVSSAGVAAYAGDTASSNAIEALSQEWGIDIQGHISRGLTDEDIDGAWLVLTMTRSHKQAVLHMFPYAAGKVFTLKEFIIPAAADDSGYNYSLDIPDPYGMPLSAYKSCARDIRTAVEALLKKLLNGQ